MKALEFIERAKDAARHKTLYVYACFGAPLTDKAKARYINASAFNQRSDRRAKINAASSDTFGFDCVCLIKAILWGWNGNLNHIYGGAVYASNGVPDVSADQMMNYCTGVSRDFSNIVPGEVVHMPGHIGIYIGDGYAVECTPIWNDGVQITAVGNIGSKPGYATRTWTDHGKLNFIDYSNPEPPKPQPTMKFKIGQTVLIHGALYRSSTADEVGGHTEPQVTTITRVNPRSAHPYNTTGDLGWMNECDISEYIKKELAIGDKVIIRKYGNGSADGSSNTAYGLGYTRRILDIYSGKPFPYQVGNDLGTTGFYSEDALEKC